MSISNYKNCMYVLYDFFLCYRAMDQCLLTRQAMARMILNSHVVVCLFAEHDSPLIGLRNLIMPLRASNLRWLEKFNYFLPLCVMFELKMLINCQKKTKTFQEKYFTRELKLQWSSSLYQSFSLSITQSLFISEG